MVAAPLTAGDTTLGQGVLRASELAVSDFATALASANVTVTLLPADDRDDPDTAVTLASTLVTSETVLGVVGHVNSECSLLAAPIYGVGGLPMISPDTTDPSLTKMGLNNVFRTCASDADQGPLAADTTVRNLRLTRAYIVDDSSSNGRLMSLTFTRRFKADGGVVIATAHTSARQTNFSALVKKIAARKPTVVYYGGTSYAGGAFAKAIKTKLPKVQLVGANGLLDPTYISRAGSRANGTLVTSVGLQRDRMPGDADFRARCAAKYPDVTIADQDAYAYDAAATMIKAVLAVANDGGAGALQSPGARGLVRAKVAATSFDGVTGRVAFTSAGEAQVPGLSLWRVRSGVWCSCADVGRPTFAASVKRNVAFSAMGTLAPRHEASSTPVVLRFYRKVGARWVLGKSAIAAAADSGAFSTYSASVLLPTKGSWRVFAEHSDDIHAVMDSTLKYFTVK